MTKSQEGDSILPESSETLRWGHGPDLTRLIYQQASGKTFNVTGGPSSSGTDPDLDLELDLKEAVSTAEMNLKVLLSSVLPVDQSGGFKGGDVDHLSSREKLLGTIRQIVGNVESALLVASQSTAQCPSAPSLPHSHPIRVSLPVLLGHASGLTRLLTLVQQAIRGGFPGPASASLTGDLTAAADPALDAALSRLSSLSEALRAAAVAREVLCRDWAPDIAGQVAIQMGSSETRLPLTHPPEGHPGETTPSVLDGPLTACRDLLESICGELSLLMEEGQKQERRLEEHAELIVGFGEMQKASTRSDVIHYPGSGNVCPLIPIPHRRSQDLRNRLGKAGYVSMAHISVLAQEAVGAPPPGGSFGSGDGLQGGTTTNTPMGGDPQQLALRLLALEEAWERRDLTAQELRTQVRIRGCGSGGLGSRRSDGSEGLGYRYRTWIGFTCRVRSSSANPFPLYSGCLARRCPGCQSLSFL